MMWAGSLRLLTQQPFSHFSFFLEGNVVCINFAPAWVFLISHQGASVIQKIILDSTRSALKHERNGSTNEHNMLLANLRRHPLIVWQLLCTWPIALIVWWMPVNEIYFFKEHKRFFSMWMNRNYSFNTQRSSLTVEQIRRLFGDNLDNFAYFSIKTYVMGTHENRFTEAILMSTHNICFYGELTKIILQLSSNTCSSASQEKGF